jgi:hypothetical protein
LYGASSMAATREKLSTAARLEAYAAAPAVPRWLTPDEKLRKLTANIDLELTLRFFLSPSALDDCQDQDYSPDQKEEDRQCDTWYSKCQRRLMPI